MAQISTSPGAGSAWISATALLAVAFGFATIGQGGNVLFGSDAARAAAGQYVPFVLWFNFLAGFAYVVAGLGLWRRRAWAAGLALAIAAGTLVISAAFAVHVATGGGYEMRTVYALALRSLLWLGIWLVARRYLRIARGADGNA